MTTIDFHAERNRTTYAHRNADPGWAVRRTGRSILHALDDGELRTLIDFIRSGIGPPPIVEKDRWTIWSAVA
jgi:hypothetical protein